MAVPDLRKKRPEYTAPDVLDKSRFNGVPVAVVDPHNEAFFYWFMAHQKRKQQNGRGKLKPALLVHVDNHDDMHHYISLSDKDKELDGTLLEMASDEEVFRFAHDTHSATFIHPAIYYGIIRNPILWFDPYNPGKKISEKCEAVYTDGEEKDYRNYFWQAQHRHGPVWWDIDLDAFYCIHHPTTCAEVEKHLAETEEFLSAMQRPELVTIALSQTPRAHVPQCRVEYLKQRTLQMVEELTR